MKRYINTKLITLILCTVLVLCGNAFAAGETINLTIGRIPVGKSVTITYDVKVNPSMPLDATQISNQGTVSGNFTSLLTNDPDTPAPNDPTVTSVINAAPVAGFVNSLVFDGIDDYVLIADDGDLTTPTAFTWETWVNITKTNWTGPSEEWAAILSKGGTAGEYWLAVNSGGQIEAGFGGTAFLSSTAAVEFDKWQHLAVTYDGSDLKFYINGSLDSTHHHSGGLTDSPDDLFIGATDAGEQHFKGQFDEIRIWQIARTGTEIQSSIYGTLDGSEADLRAYWRFDSVSGTTAYDGSSNFNHGTLTNMTVPDAWVLSAVRDFIVGEDGFFSGMLAGSDGERAGLTFSIVVNADKGTATISDPATGAFTYTPSLNENGSDSFTFKVNDGNDDSNTATVHVGISLVNDPPVLGSIGNQSVSELLLLTFTATATDADLPADALTYSLDAGAPAGAAIDPSTGVFTWTPTEAQGPGVYSVTVLVKDNGKPAAEDFETIQITVNEVNTSPVLGSIGNRTVDELSQLTFTATATDGDFPANGLTYSLDAGAPAGAAISPSTGVFTWTPTEAQGPGVYSVTVRVKDNGTPAAEDFETIQITVNEVCSSASITVDSADDAGSGTLRQAILDLCPGGVIDFNIPGAGPHSILLTSGDLPVDKNLTISGPGAANLIVSGSSSQRVFSVTPGVIFVLNDLTVSSGSADRGAGLLNSGGAVTMNACEFVNCLGSVKGGAIYNQSGTLVIKGSTVYGNSAQSGGGVFSEQGSITITNSTISGNSATGTSNAAGGGIIIEGGMLTVVNSSISGNISAAGSGGIHNVSGAVTLRNSIVAGNTAISDPDTGGTFVSEGYNLLEDKGTANITGPATGDIYGQDPLLGTLRDNGGSTRTMALLPGSPAVNTIAAGTNGCGTSILADQRSVARPQGGSCDMGAYEFIPDTTTVLVSSLNPSTYGDIVNFTAEVSGSQPESIPAGSVTFRDAGSVIAGCTDVTLSSGVSICSPGSLTGGSHSITAEYSGDGGYSASTSVPVSQIVNRAGQSITFDQLPNLTADAPPFTVTAAATSGLNISFSSLTLPVCSVFGSTVTLTHLTGVCIIGASQDGDSNYSAATPVSRSFNVNPSALSHIAISPASATITAGESKSYTAEGFDQYSNSRGDITGSTAFSIGPDGSCTASNCGAIISGFHTVTGSYSGKTAGANLIVNPGEAVSIIMSGPAEIKGGVAFDVSLEAKDAYNNTATGYTGTVHFTSSDLLAGLPADYSFVAGDNGARTFAGGVVLRTAGTQSVGAADISRPLAGGSLNILVDLFAVAGTIVSGSGTIVCSPADMTFGGGFNCSLCPSRGYDLYRLYDTGVNRTNECTVNGYCYSYAATNVTADHAVKVAYVNYPVIILYGANSDCFSNIQEAVDSALNDDRIQAQGFAFTENLYFNLPGVAASLEGGYDSDFSSSTGHTVINGSVTIINGTITIQDITIR